MEKKVPAVTYDSNAVSAIADFYQRKANEDEQRFKLSREMLAEIDAKFPVTGSLEKLLELANRHTQIVIRMAGIGTAISNDEELKSFAQDLIDIRAQLIELSKDL